MAPLRLCLNVLCVGVPGELRLVDQPSSRLLGGWKALMAHVEFEAANGGDGVSDASTILSARQRL
jgi:hypothetical protein